MRYKFVFALLTFISSPGVCNAQFFDNLLQKGVDSLSQEKSQIGSELSEDSIIAGLKEALQVGVGKAVDYSSKADGYLENPQIKIPIPEKIQNVADMLKNIGLQKPVDDFVLSMNRAAEAASPQAKDILLSAVQNMTFDDAKNVLNGGDTAATDYLRK